MKKKTKEKPKIKTEKIVCEPINPLMDGMLLDAVIEVLKAKGLLTDKDIDNQIKQNTKEIEKFMKRNPQMVDTMVNDLVSQREVEKEKSSYIG